MTNGTPATSVRSGVALSTLGNLAAPIASLVTAPLLAQALGVDGRGQLAAATAPLLLAASGLTFGIPETMTFFVARGASSRRATLVSGLVGSTLIGVIGTLLIAGFAPLLSGGDEKVRYLITIVGLGLTPSMIATSLRGYMRGSQLWLRIALDLILASFFRVGAMAVLALTDSLTPLTAGVVTVAANFVGIVVYLFPHAGRAVNMADSAADHELTGRRLRVDMAQYGMGVWLGAAGGILLSRLDQVLILPLSTTAVLGLYAVAVSIADVVRVFNSAVRDVVFSAQSAIRNDEALGRASRVSTILTFLGAIGIALASWGLVPRIFGQEFSGAVVLIIVLLLGTVIGNPGSVLAAGLSARGRPILRSMAIGLGVCVNIVGVYLMVPPFGALGAAMASSLANIATAALVIYFAHRHFQINPGLVLRFSRTDLTYVGNVVRVIGRRRG